MNFAPKSLENNPFSVKELLQQLWELEHDDVTAKCLGKQKARQFSLNNFLRIG